MLRKIIFFTLIVFSGFIISTQAESYRVVGTDLPPLMYQKENQTKGFYVDILREMVSSMKGIDITFKFYPAPRLFMVLSKSKETFSLGMTRNEKREKLYKWVGPIYPRIFALYKLKNRTEIKAEKLEDIKSYTVGVGRGYAAVDDLLNAGIPRENIVEATTDALNIRMLFSNRIDFVIMNDVMLSYRLGQEGHSWEDIEQTIILNDTYQFWFAFNKGIDDRVIKKFQDALDLLRKNGSYDAIVKKYFD